MKWRRSRITVSGHQRADHPKAYMQQNCGFPALLLVRTLVVRVTELAWEIWYALLVSNNKTERAVHFFSTETLFPNNWSKKGTKKLCKVFATGCLFSFDTAQHYISWPVEKIECWLRLRCKDLRMRFYILICCLNCDHIFPVRFKSNQIGWKPQLREFVRKIHQRVWGRKPKGLTKSICWWSTSHQDM